MRDPDRHDEPHVPGGRAAERLRQFLAARLGDDAPPIPPDEVDEVENATAGDVAAADNDTRDDDTTDEPPDGQSSGNA